MRKLLTGLLAASMLIPTIASADPDRHNGDRGDQRDRGGDHRGGDRGWHDRDRRGYGGRPDGWRQFHRGERFDQRRAWNYGEVDYRVYRGLRPPPRGYHWVRNGNDAVLVGIASGIVAGVVAGAIMR